MHACDESVMRMCNRPRCSTETRCGVRGIGQVAKLLAARAEVRLTRAFGSGTVRQGRCRRERGVEVTVREQQGWRMEHENGRARWRDMTCALQTP